MCKLYTPEVLAMRAGLLSACLAFYFCTSLLNPNDCGLRNRKPLRVGDVVLHRSLYCVWTGHTSVVTDCCSATCTTVQHLVKWRAKLLFSTSPLNLSRSVSLSFYWFAFHSSLPRLLFISRFTLSLVSLLSVLPIKSLLALIDHTQRSGPSHYCSYTHRLSVCLVLPSFRTPCGAYQHFSVLGEVEYGDE